MQVLYVSDLDGTLLTSKGNISVYSKNVINDLVNRGLNFTIATARTAATAAKILSGLDLKLPVLLMNGVVQYDTKKQIYLARHDFSERQSQAILACLAKTNLPAFVYSIESDQLSCYTLPDKLLNTEMLNFKQERITKYDKKFTLFNSYADLWDKKIIYFTLLGKYQDLERVCQDLEQISGVSHLLYPDVYNDDWILEIHQSKINKGVMCQELKNSLQVEKLVVFADNLNDYPMLEVADYSYAVANAKTEIKQKANMVIGSNDEDAVARTLLELY